MRGVRAGTNFVAEQKMADFCKCDGLRGAPGECQLKRLWLQRVVIPSGARRWVCKDCWRKLVILVEIEELECEGMVLGRVIFPCLDSCFVPCSFDGLTPPVAIYARERFRGGKARTGPAGRWPVNLIGTRKPVLSEAEGREHSRKPDEMYDLISSCSPAGRLEIFARGPRKGWTVWGNQAEDYEIGWDTYAHDSRVGGEVVWGEAAE